MAVFVDGENLAVRFAAACRDKQQDPRCLLHYEEGTFAWSIYLHVAIRQEFPTGPIHYFTSVSGDDAKRDSLVGRVKRYGLVPHVRKRRKNDKSKGVDVALAVAATVYAIEKKPERILLISGDADFVPLVQLCRQRYAHVSVWSFPIGLSPEVEREADACDTTRLSDVLSSSLTPSTPVEVVLSGGPNGGHIEPADGTWQIGADKDFGGNLYRREPTTPTATAVFVGRST